MKIYILLVATLLLTAKAWAAPGDTTVVQAHQAVDMTWYQSYKSWAAFPDNGQTYHKILMEFTLGCATGGCSDWDYTTLINLLYPTGQMDSTVASIDTISTNPYVIDTTWRVFEVRETFELAKVITPYGGNLANNWTRTFYFDVTDYYPLMRDSVEIEAFYQGWSSGFSATLNFIMIEGTPPRNVLSIENLYRGKFNYLNSAQFEGNHMPQRTVEIDSTASQFFLRMAPSGHGFVNSLNCAEFCKKDYLVKVNSQQVARQAMWRNDCGLNDLWPQAGTWLLDRANWCPGDRVNIHNHDLTPHISGSTAQIDVDVEAYSYTVPSGQVPANYNMSGQFFQMGNFNHQVDAELEEILSPNDADEYARHNPVCQEASVRIKNKGSQNLTSLTIHYGVKGSLNWQQAKWTGNLAPLESELVMLPMDSLSQWSSLNSQPEFAAFITKVNGTTDEVPYNNQLSASFTPPQRLPGSIRFDLRTNNAASETHWELIDLASGSILKSGDNLSNSTSYRDTFNFSPGCYQLIIHDRDKDGIAYFGNNDGSGRASLRNIGGDFFALNINPNFGTQYSLQFTVGYGISLPENQNLSQRLQVFPNPSKGKFQLSLAGANKIEGEYRVSTLSGKVISQGTIQGQQDAETTIDLSHQPKGLYFLQVSENGQHYVQKLVVE